VKFFLFILLLICSPFLSCSNKNITFNDISEYPITKSPQTFPLNIYVSKDFNNIQRDAIIDASNDWQTFSNGIIKINLVFDWDYNVPFKINYFIHEHPYITIWKKQWNDPDLFDLQLRTSFVATGFSLGNIIILVNRDDLDYRNTYVIFAHELGHTLGLEHIKPKYPALMNLHTKGYFSKYDKLMFCEIYNCH
jgi:hypothetical protein